MLRFGITFAIGLMSSATFAANVKDCEGALAKDSFNQWNTARYDWRLATLVTREQYNEAKTSAGSDAVIHGIPMGADYDDFKKNIENYASMRNETLSAEMSSTTAIRVLGEAGLAAYRSCLAVIKSQNGFLLSQENITDDSISLSLHYTPSPKGPRMQNITWSGPADVLPTSKPHQIVGNGTVAITVKRPTTGSAIVRAQSAYFTSEVVVPARSPVLVIPPPITLTWTDPSGKFIRNLPVEAQGRLVYMKVDGRSYSKGAGEIWGEGKLNDNQFCGHARTQQSINMNISFECTFIAPKGGGTVQISIEDSNAYARGVAAYVSVR